MEDVFGEKHRL